MLKLVVRKTVGVEAFGIFSPHVTVSPDDLILALRYHVAWLCVAIQQMMVQIDVW